MEKLEGNMIKVNIERETSLKDIDNTSLVEERNSKLFDMIKRVVIPATGCTEPVAIALNAATARKYFKGNIKKINIRLDISLIKNAMGVAIPGIKARGIASCVAIGILIGTDEKGMNILSDACKFSDDDVESLLPIIEVSIAEGYEGLYIETILIGENECIRVITENTHSNITSIEHGNKVDDFKNKPSVIYDPFKNLGEYNIEDLVNFADTLDSDRLDFFRAGIDMNLEIAKRGIELEFGQVNERLRANGDLSHSLISDIEFYTSCASYARMSGESLPVMTITGSGNQGILLFLPLYIIAKKKNIDEERMLRSIAFAQVFNLYAKHFIGILSPICSCGVASGVAVSAATVYLLNGTIDQIKGAIKTMLSCITGMICDGAKESCAHKVSLSSGFAVKAALQSMEGLAIKDGGIITSDIADLYERVSTLSKEGMKSANKTMIDIMFSNITT